MPEFVNREFELEKICATAGPWLLTFYGEAGIGKTSLLDAAEIRLRSQAPPPIVARVDFESLEQYKSDERPRRVLQSLVASDPGLAILQQENISVGQLIRFLCERDPIPVLMFDTTESLQTDTGFWEWLESEIVRPLLMAGCARFIFAGRVLAPWRDYDVRRQNQIHRLAPLPTRDDPKRQGAVRTLIRDVLRQGHRPGTEAQVEALIELILEFSHGHPGLSKQLAEWAAPVTGRWPTADYGQLRREMAVGPVKEFIDGFLFKSIDAEWRLILWWASILNWFDTAVLRQYLEALVAAGVISRCSFLDNWDSFFVPGIDRLRLQDAAVVWEKAGYRLHGVTREIVRQWLRVTDPVRFAQANRCAGQVIAAVADEFAPDEEGFARYKSEAEVYFQQAQGGAV